MSGVDLSAVVLATMRGVPMAWAAVRINGVWKVRRVSC